MSYNYKFFNLQMLYKDFLRDYFNIFRVKITNHFILNMFLPNGSGLQLV